VLLRTEAVGACIRDGKTFMLPGIMQTGGKMGMRLMDDSLLELFHEGLISAEEAYARCEVKSIMRENLAGHL
jgi:twitching motility protein PilT